MAATLCVGAALLVVGCRPAASDATIAAREGRLLISSGADPENLDPHSTTGVPEFKIERELFEGLVREEKSLHTPFCTLNSWPRAPLPRTYSGHE